MTKPESAKSAAVTTIAAALEAQRQINALAETLGSKKADLDGQIEQLEAQNATLWRMPLMREEVKALLLESVDRIGAEHVEKARLADVVRAYAYPRGSRPANDGPVGLESYRFGPHPTAINLLDLDALGPGGPSTAAVNRVLGLEGSTNLFSGAASEPGMEARRAYFFFGDIIKAQIERHFESLCPEIRSANGAVQPATPISVARRREQIAANEESIDALRAESHAIELQLAEIAGARSAQTAC